MSTQPDALTAPEDEVVGPLAATFPTQKPGASGTSAAVGENPDADAWTRFVVADYNYTEVFNYNDAVANAKLNGGTQQSVKAPMLWECVADPTSPSGWAINQTLAWFPYVPPMPTATKFVSAVGAPVPNLPGIFSAIMAQVTEQGVRPGLTYKGDPRGPFVLVAGTPSWAGTPYWFVPYVAQAAE